MLPSLPKRNNKKEADFGLVFREYINKKRWPVSADFELKDSRGKDRIPYSEIRDDQWDSAARSLSDKGNLMRISVGTPGAPDYAYRRNAPTYVVIRFPKSCEVISFETLALERERSKAKSLTWERAREISVTSFR